MLQFGYTFLQSGYAFLHNITSERMRGFMKTENIPLSYKGRPLRRKDNLIYYGSMSDPYIVLLQILETKPLKDLEIATRVSIQLQLTDSNVKSRDIVVKRSEKDSLYSAMDIASVWLERALSSR
jgi:hypothetical protein